MSVDVTFNESVMYFKSETAIPDLGGESLTYQFLGFPQEIIVSQPPAQNPRLIPSDEANKTPTAPLDTHVIEAEGSGEEAAYLDESNTDTPEVPIDDRDVATADNNQIPYEQDAEDMEWPIALRKGIRSCRKRVNYPLCHYVSYEKISLEYKSFLTELDNMSVPKTVNEALASKD